MQRNALGSGRMFDWYAVGAIALMFVTPFVALALIAIASRSN